MAVYGLKPTFKDLKSYKQWRVVWAETYLNLVTRIRTSKKALHAKQLELGSSDPATILTAHKLRAERVMAYKLNTLLNEAKMRMANITKMKREMTTHHSAFPLTFENCKNVDFHFNKKHLEHDFIPMWIIKVKGSSYYVTHVESMAKWTTRETPDHPATKGAIRFRNCQVSISADGVATIH